MHGRHYHKNGDVQNEGKLRGFHRRFR
jgi:hypothetical protein